MYDQQTQKRDDLDRMLHQSMQYRFQYEKQRLHIIQQRIRIKYFYDYIQRQKQQSLDFKNALNKQMQRVITQKKQQFEQKLLTLDNLSPTKTMLRGYSIVMKDDNVVTSSHDIHEGDNIEVTMKDGKLDATIKKVRWNNDNRK